MTPQELAAIEYAEAGAMVLPLHTPTSKGCSCMRDCGRNKGKHPRTLHGKDDATDDLETVRRWWTMWPTANVGVRPAPGVVVLDVDPRNGGATALLELERQHSELPVTQCARTGGGGLHVWLALTGPVRGQLTTGIDVKTAAGYVVMPPSVHESGDSYEWLNTQAGIRPAPRWVVEMLAPATVPLPISTSTTPAQIAGLIRTVREAPVGQRNSILNWAAWKAVKGGADPTPLIAAAVEAGLPEDEATRTVASATKGAAA